jgi:Na+/proline symporter
VGWAVGGFCAGLARVAPERLSLLVAEEGPLDRLEKMAVVICGSMVAVELISRFLGARSARVAIAGTLAGGVMYLVVGLIPVYLGLVGPDLIKDLKETEQIVPRLAEANLPRLAYTVFLGALVSAILSVVHAALHAPAAQLTHNIIAPLRPQASPRARLISVRLTVLALSLVAFGLAHTVEHIKDLVEIASAFGSAGAFVVAVMGLFTRIGGPAAAIAALISGVVVWAGAKFTFALETPYITGLAAAFLAYGAIAAVEQRLRVAQSG